MGDRYVVYAIGWLYWSKSRLYWYAVRSVPVNIGRMTLIMFKISLFKNYLRFKRASHSLLVDKRVLTVSKG